MSARRANIHNLTWIRRMVEVHGVPLAVAVQAEGRICAARRLPKARRLAAVEAVSTWMVEQMAVSR